MCWMHNGRREIIVVARGSILAWFFREEMVVVGGCWLLRGFKRPFTFLKKKEISVLRGHMHSSQLKLFYHNRRTFGMRKN